MRKCTSSVVSVRYGRYYAGVDEELDRDLAHQPAHTGPASGGERVNGDAPRPVIVGQNSAWDGVGAGEGG